MDSSTTVRLNRAMRAPACTIAALVIVLSLLGAQRAQASAQGEPASAGTVSATLEECLTASVQAERAAMFSGEMTSVPGAARMAVRIDLEERLPGELEYHTVMAPGLGVWRASDPRVKVYRYLKQVTNLTAPASYRGLVRFRWINARGRVIRRAERLTARCLQPAPPAEPTETSGASAPSATATSAATARA
ncbi:MAG TPA: hypothetical protein VN672_11715 [Solirubrobacteraceae bacterium]|nr:hypothetical protein [Solirubrobacteraceae bacterium]